MVTDGSCGSGTAAKVTRFQRVTAALLITLAAAAHAQTGDDPLDLDHPAIAYRTAPRTDPVAELNRRLETGAVLSFERRGGYLRSLLQELDIAVESQIALFSTTSLQGRLITPSNPRTIFFNDSVTVAWMNGGFIEVAAHDPRQGASFYILPQAATEKPRLLREERCLGCHYTANASGVPGFFARSIPTAVDGAPLPWLGNATIDHRSPLDERWAGWYVTGDAGTRRHLGNVALTDRRAQELPPWTADRPLPTLDGRINAEAYLSPHSDIVALLVFGHQTRMMNLLTRLGWRARIAAHDRRAPTTLEDDVAALVDYMLFVDEAPLGRVRGTSGYAQRFSARGPRDRQGRSLRDLDLETRLLRYPCSYMIYSPAFDALPQEAREMVYRRLKDVLSGREAAPRYARITPGDRQAILEILRDTKTNLPSGF
jgi:hypothetical protein